MIRDIILVILTLVWLIWVVYWRFDYAKDYPQCMLARDMVTCVEVVRGNR